MKCYICNSQVSVNNSDIILTEDRANQINDWLGEVPNTPRQVCICRTVECHTDLDILLENRTTLI